jgi:hypothetical protein
VAGDETVGTLSTLGTLKSVGTLNTLGAFEAIRALSTLWALETVGTLSRAGLTSGRGGARGSATEVRRHVSALAERSRLLPRSSSRLGGSTTAGFLGGQALSPATTTTGSSSWARGEAETGRGTLRSRLGDETTTRLAGTASGLGLFLALLLLLSNLVEFAISSMLV